jgi:hypothetical protein
MTTTTHAPPTSRTAARLKHNRRPEQTEACSSQHLATEFLVRGCERALFDLRCSLGAAATSREVRVGLEAAALLEQVLAGWRDTLRLLRAASAAESPTCTPR